MPPEPVTFEPVDEDADPSEPSPEAAGKGRGVSEDPPPRPVRDAERDPYPLAGPILDQTRARELRGRCSSCDARLRLRLEDDRRRPVRVRCPICGRTGEIDAP